MLEHTDVQERANGISEVSAAVLFRTERMPAWAFDTHVIGATRPNIPPWRVIPILFRNQGDGWRYATPSNFLGIRTKTHIVGADGGVSAIHARVIRSAFAAWDGKLPFHDQAPGC